MKRLVAEFRAEVTGDTLRGHAAVFGQQADIGPFVEELAPTAFDAVLAGDPDVRALINHDPNLLLARTTNGSLKLATDDTGLAVEFKIPDTSYGRDLQVLVGQGLLTGMSFGFTPGEEQWSRTDGGRRLWTHTSVAELWDVSPVTFPAYDGTDVGLRALRPARFKSPVLDRRTQLILARHRALTRQG